MGLNDHGNLAPIFYQKYLDIKTKLTYTNFKQKYQLKIMKN